MPAQVITGIQDAHIVNTTKLRKTNQGKHFRVFVRADPRENGLYWAPLTSIPRGATVLSAKLQVFTQSNYTGTRTVRLYKITKKWSHTSVTWSNAPTTGPLLTTVTKSNPQVGTPYEFDITSDVQTAVNGATSWGWVMLGQSGTITFCSAEHKTAKYKPRLLVDYALAPDVPTALNPNGEQVVSTARPTLQFSYRDRSSTTALAAIQVQVFDGENWMNTVVDSGEVPTSTAQWTPTVDLAPEGGSFTWRARVKNIHGMWSGWSSVASARRVAKPTLVIESPQAEPNNFVEDKSPSFLWNFSGTQTAYRVIHSNPNNTGQVYLDSGWISSASDGHNLLKPLTFVNGEARVTIQVRDDQDRAATPGDPAYIEATRVFTYKPSSSITQVTNFTAQADLTPPRVNLTWNRAEAPDSFRIERNGKVIAEFEPWEINTTGTGYAFTDWNAPCRTELDYRVYPVTDGKSATTSPSANAFLKPVYAWLTDPETGWYLPIASRDELNATYAESSAIHQVIGARQSVLIAQSFRGLEGSFSGSLHSGLPGVGDLSAQQLKERVFYLKQNPTKTYRFILADTNIGVVVRNVSVKATPKAELTYLVSFELYQQTDEYDTLPF